MHQVSILVVAAPVILISFAFVIGHIVSWRRFSQRADDEPSYETRFRRNQFRRRLQASAMLGVVAVAMIVGTVAISSEERPKTFVGLWTGILMTVLWVILLAGADMIATRRHANRLRREVLAQHRDLHDAVRREFGAAAGREADATGGQREHGHGGQ